LGSSKTEVNVSTSDWSSLMNAREELERSATVLPIMRNRGEGRSQELDPRTVRFAEALAVSPDWARIDAARRRLAA
jgi:hypothetical protein